MRRRFDSEVETIGVVCDDRQKPRIVCFRQMGEAAVQVFAVLWDP
jgi:hypothetical protein